MRNLDIYLFGGENQTNANQKVEGTDSDNKVSDVNLDYRVDAQSNLVLIVIPHKEKYDTLIDIKYSIDGVRRSKWNYLIASNFSNEAGLARQIFTITCVSLIILITFVVICLKLTQKKEEQVQKVHTAPTIPDVKFDDKGNMIIANNTGQNIFNADNENYLESI